MNKGMILLLAALPAACAVAPPSAPTVLAVPGKDKTFAAFQQDEAQCRYYAQTQSGGAPEAATNAAVGSAAVGTVAGAAVGALIGAAAGNAGAGAAVGAGSGLLVGGSVGASNAAAYGGDLQRRYDFAYIQCMTANGENIQSTATEPYGGPAYGYSAYDYEPPVVVGGPVIGFGFGGGYGGYGYRHGFGHGGYGRGGYGGGYGGGGRYWRHW